MPHNILITGSPRIGKTTILQRVNDRLTARGYQAGGIYCPERRVDDERVGMDLVDVMTGETRTLAHVDRTDGPNVGRYRVNVDNVDTMYTSAFQHAFANADVLLVDEIAPMQTYSEEFPDQIRKVLDAKLPLIATIQYASTDGFIGAVKRRDDIELVEVTKETREELPATITDMILGRL